VVGKQGFTLLGYVLWFRGCIDAHLVSDTSFCLSNRLWRSDGNPGGAGRAGNGTRMTRVVGGDPGEMMESGRR